MSLRRRLVLVVILAVLALGASLRAVIKLRAEGARAREAQAFDQGTRVIDALSRRVGAGFTKAALDALDTQQSAALRSYELSLITPLVDASAGFCVPAGELSSVETVAPFAVGPDDHHPDVDETPPSAARHDAPRPEPGHDDRVDEAPSPAAQTSMLPFPLDRDARFDEFAPELKLGRGAHMLRIDRHVVERTCRNLQEGELAQVRFAAPNDLLFVSARKLDPALAVFALVRMPNRSKDDRGSGWQVNVVLICAFTLLLVILTLDALIALRRGTAHVEDALSRLGHDLRAQISNPRIAELARIADALRSMAADLATARDRERSLEGRLAHEQRLSGLGRVVAGVAHEVRNPLAGLKLKLDLLLRRELEPRTRADIEVCLTEVARLDRVVSSLLLVSRREPLDCAPCDVHSVLRERAEAARPDADARGIRIEVCGSARALAHREHLVRIVDNLLRNALEASPRDGTVSMALTAANGTTQLSVSDAGDGVPAECLGQLFEPFFTLKPEGTGLGLFLCRSLAEAQHGSLCYARHEDKTYFHLTLPAA